MSVDCEIPPARTGHVSVGFDDYILVWGGYEEGIGTNIFFRGSDIWLFNCLTEKWIKQTTRGFLPNCVSGACAVRIQDYMYIFGGFGYDGAINVLLRLNLKNLQWDNIQPTGTLPMPMDKMVGWHYNRKFYTFGGFGLPDMGLLAYDFQFVFHAPTGRGWTNQFFEYDILNNKWSTPAFTGSLPSARAAHAAAVHDGKAYIFGGRHGNFRLNDMHCLDMDKMEWSVIKSEEETAPGSTPVGRSWHSLTALQNHFLVLYGGFSQHEEPLSDCWLFDTRTRKWLAVDLPFKKPRVWHSASLNLFNEVVIHGGCTGNILANSRASQANDIIIISLQPRSLFRLCVEYFVDQPQYKPLWKNLPNSIQAVLHQRSERCPPNLEGS